MISGNLIRIHENWIITIPRKVDKRILTDKTSQVIYKIDGNKIIFLDLYDNRPNPDKKYAL